MKIDIRFRSIDDAELKTFASEQIAQHFKRFGNEVTHLVLRLDDVNGPKEGIDKRCQISIVAEFGSLTIEHLSADAQSAIETTVDRMASAIERHLERAKRRESEPL
jgi:putative sigma-54 modulation protein